MSQTTISFKPVSSFQDTVKKVENIISSEGSDLHPLGHTRLLSHGKKTGAAVLWFHGYSSAPQQFIPLGEKCFELGMNVYIPRAPHHGLNDRLTEETRKLTEEELKAWAEESLQITRGLGDRVIVGGLSMGGAVTTWLAQEYPEIDLAIIIAPAIAYRVLPSFLLPVAIPVISWLPDSMHWWDAKLKENIEGADYNYAWVSMHGLAIFPRMGMEIRKLNRKTPPAAKEIWMVINDHDADVDGGYVQKVAEEWKAKKPDAIHTYHFLDGLGIVHDCISVENSKQRVDIVYPVLLDIISGRAKDC
jgi:pimeloyl-ACP methyl ester carboxylesterase